MCNKHVHSTSGIRCLIGVINKPTTVELCISPEYHSDVYHGQNCYTIGGTDVN